MSKSFRWPALVDVRRRLLVAAFFSVVAALVLPAPCAWAYYYVKLPTTVPYRVMNGDFEYPEGALGAADSVPAIAWVTGSRVNACQIGAMSSQIACEDPSYDILTLSKFDSNRFQWVSNQMYASTSSQVRLGGGVDLRMDPVSGNRFAEAAPTIGGPDLVHSLRTPQKCYVHLTFKHGAYAEDGVCADKMSVYLPFSRDNPPKASDIVAVRRTATNGVDLTQTPLSAGAFEEGDTNQVGYVSTVVESVKDGTTGKHRYDMEGAWEEYEAWTVAPSPCFLAVIFRAASHGGIERSAIGNFIDDVAITYYYTLSYDANGGGGTVPQSEAQELDFGYANVYAAGESAPVDDGAGSACTVFQGARGADGRSYRFMGWSETASDWATSADELARIETVTEHEMVLSSDASINTVYAVYARNPVVSIVDDATDEVLDVVAVEYGEAVGALEAPERVGYTAALSGVPEGALTSDCVVRVAYTPLNVKLKVPVSIGLKASADGGIMLDGSYRFENEEDLPVCVSGMYVEEKGLTFTTVAAAVNPGTIGLRVAPAGGQAVELAEYVGAAALDLERPADWRVEPGGSLGIASVSGRAGDWSWYDPGGGVCVGTIHWVFAPCDGGT